MKIGFWSSLHGQARTTSNMIAASVLMCARHKKKVAVMQTHFELNNLSYPLIGVADGDEDFRDTGIDALVRDYKSRPLSESIILSDSISQLSRQYNIFLGTGNRNRDAFEGNMEITFCAIADEVDKYHDFTFIDIASGRSRASLKAIANCDVLIVNVCQNRFVLDEYFAEPINHESILYAFGNYSFDSGYNGAALRKIYPQIKGKCYCVPYNPAYMDAQNNGKMMPFILQNMNCTKDSSNYPFIRYATRLVDELWERGEQVEDS